MPESKLPAVGLTQNVPGVPFRCGSCRFFNGKQCHNPDPRLNGRPVQPVWCCNFYHHDGMRTIVP